MKTLENFLLKNVACEDGFDFAKNLTLEQFLNTCDRGDWILWLFAKINPNSLRELTLAKGHCANTVRHLMNDERSLEAVDVSIKFGEGKATRKQLDFAAANASSAANAAYVVANAYAAANAAYVVAGDAGDASASAYQVNQKLTADICRQYLPLEIWDQF
tara:strand:- start:1151 stop:1630 length:480 start_codon:yes stop_codon:yes gene_type:complete